MRMGEDLYNSLETEEDAEADHENPSLARGFCLDPFPSLTLYSGIRVLQGERLRKFENEHIHPTNGC
jgi:hypothetical protein